MATGPERHTRKFTAIRNDNEVEYYGVLIAEAGDHWRARIFTYPDTLWTVPGGGGTVKFAGATAREAEALATAYVEEHGVEHECRITETVEDEIPMGGGSKNARTDVEERHPCKLPIRFGEERATQVATTANLSPQGIYIATDHVVDKGTRLRMSLSVQAYTISLVGKVMWARREEEPGKPKGIGVQLEKPPALYLRYVEEVRETIPKS